MNGKIALDGATASFEVVERENVPTLIVRPRSSSPSCTYELRRLEAPRQTRGISGVIETRIQKCSAWKNIDTVSVYFKYTKKGWVGDALLESGNKRQFVPVTDLKFN